MYDNCCLKYCKNKTFSIIKKSNYCKNHSILLFNKYIIIIQKHYKGYYCRKKLKNLFYNLPTDIQKKIIYFINENIYFKNYIKSIRNIIRKKTSSIILYNTFKEKHDIGFIKNIYYLNDKYRNILYLNDLKYLYVYGEDIINVLHNYLLNIYEDNMFFLPEYVNINIDIDIDLTNVNLIDIINTITTIYNFRINYNNEINIIKNAL